jgi:hypothetical protein
MSFKNENELRTNLDQKGKELTKVEIDNLFSYLEQQVDSPKGLVDKSKTLANILLKENVFNYLVKTSLNKTTSGGINIGSQSTEGFTYTSVHTTSEKEEHYSIYARQKIGSLENGPGIVKGFLLRKEKTRKGLKNSLEARIELNNGKECTLRYDYTSAQLN